MTELPSTVRYLAPTAERAQLNRLQALATAARFGYVPVKRVKRSKV